LRSKGAINKAGHSYPGGLVSEPNARHPYTDVDAWRRGIAKAVRNKLRPGYSDCYLVIFALRCRFQTIDFAFAQVVRPAIEQVGDAECERAFRGLYVFDDQPPAIFELSDPCFSDKFTVSPHGPKKKQPDGIGWMRTAA
jgi:hypothetical protein